MKYRIQILLLLLLCTGAWSRAQVDSVYDPGIGMVIRSGGFSTLTTILVQPDKTSDTVASLKEWNYTRRSDAEEHRAFLVGFRKYDYWGLPILGFNKDSSWVRVLVASTDGEIHSEGWVDLSIPETSIRIWADYLPSQRCRLLEDSALRFYSKPNKTAIWNIKIARHPTQGWANYVLSPIRREGRWLLVELETPTRSCGKSDEDLQGEYGVKSKRVRVWIEYLDERMRPLVRQALMC